MPPAAISRSSTYFPKIWGNIPDRHPSALRRLSPLFALAVVFPACQPESPPGRTLLVQARSLDACPVSARARIELQALGDFEASNRTAESASANASALELSFPLSTRAVTAEANDGDDRWLGAGTVYDDAAEL